MQFTFTHNNFNVSNPQASLDFYSRALGLKESGRVERDGFTLVYLSDGVTNWRLELTWLSEHPHPYNLGENEIHLALAVDDFEAARDLHNQMGCICYENRDMGIYFIEDPDGYWIEILPQNRA